MGVWLLCTEAAEMFPFLLRLLSYFSGWTAAPVQQLASARLATRSVGGPIDPYHCPSTGSVTLLILACYCIPLCQCVYACMCVQCLIV